MEASLDFEQLSSLQPQKQDEIMNKYRKLRDYYISKVIAHDLDINKGIRMEAINMALFYNDTCLEFYNELNRLRDVKYTDIIRYDNR